MSAQDLPPALHAALGAAALKRIGRRRKRVVFLVHAPELYNAIEPVAREMQRRPDEFDVVHFALPRNYSGKETEKFAGLEQTYLYLDAKGCKPVALPGRSPRDLETLIRLAPDFIFRQTPWSPDIPTTFDTTQLGFAHVCYVPYGLAMVEKPESQYNQPFHNACDFIFCENDFEYDAYANHRRMGAVGVQTTGYPRFEQLVADLAAADPDAWPLPAPAAVPRVIWAPHHSFDADWLGYSTFLLHKDAMLAEARRGRISFLLRPHPATRERIVAHGAMTEAEYDAYLNAFAEAGCSGVDRAIEYAGSFAASDAMITDGLGFFSEYLLTGKPLIRTRRADSIPLNAFARWLVEAFDNVDDGPTLERVLESLAQRRYADPHAALRAERRQLLTAMSVGASSRIVDALQTW